MPPSFHPIWLCMGWIVLSPLWSQHDRERNAFRYLAEGKVEKAYFELKNGKKHTDPAEKAFISTLCLVKEGRTQAAFIMAQKAVGLGLPFERFLTEPRKWQVPLRELNEFQNWKDKIQPSLLIHGPMVGQVTDSSASFWFRTDGACEIAVEITGHSGLEKIRTSEEEGFVGVVHLDGLLPNTYFAYRIFINGEEYLDLSLIHI